MGLLDRKRVTVPLPGLHVAVLFCTCSCEWASQLPWTSPDCGHHWATWHYPKLDNATFFDSESLPLFRLWRLDSTLTTQLVIHGFAASESTDTTFSTIDCQALLPNCFHPKVLVATHTTSVSAFVRLCWLVFELAVIVYSTSLSPCPTSAWSPWASSAHYPTIRALPFTFFISVVEFSSDLLATFALELWLSTRPVHMSLTCGLVCLLLEIFVLTLQSGLFSPSVDSGPCTSTWWLLDVANPLVTRLHHLNLVRWWRVHTIQFFTRLDIHPLKTSSCPELPDLTHPLQYHQFWSNARPWRSSPTTQTRSCGMSASSWSLLGACSHSDALTQTISCGLSCSRLGPCSEFA